MQRTFEAAFILFKQCLDLPKGGAGLLTEQALDLREDALGDLKVQGDLGRA